MFSEGGSRVDPVSMFLAKHKKFETERKVSKSEGRTRFDS